MTKVYEVAAASASTSAVVSRPDSSSRRRTKAAGAVAADTGAHSSARAQPHQVHPGIDRAAADVVLNVVEGT